MKVSRVYFLLAVSFCMMAMVVFRCAWGENKIFSGSDANIGLLTSYDRVIPARFTGTFSPTPLFGGSSSIPYSMANFGLMMLNPEAYSNCWYAVYLIISSIALIAYLRLWTLRWLSCVLGALSAFWVGSITIAASGHLYKLGVIALFSLALLLVEKSMRAGGLRCAVWSVLSGASVGLMLLEQQDVGLLAGIFLGVYAIVRLVQSAGNKWKKWLLVLVPIALVGVTLSATTAVTAYTTNVTKTGVNERPQQKWEYITQWSMVPSELPDLIAPGYTGWSTGNPDGPYWGKCGQSAEWKTTGKGFRNFRLDSIYIGFLPILLALFGSWTATRNRKDQEGGGAVFLLWSILGLVAISLSFGKFSPLYKLFYQLPLVGNIRAPIKFLHNFQVIIGILSAYGVNHLISVGEQDPRNVLKKMLWVGATLATIFIILAVTSQTDAYGNKFSEWGQYASVITSNISRAWGHAALMAGLFCAFIFFTWKKSRISKGAVVMILIGAIAFDSVYITTRYFKAVDISELKKGNAVINYLKEHQGTERIYFLNQSGVYNSWLALEVPYHGLQVFNIWQMPRMPADYKQFLGTVGRNQMRLWQLASIKYIAAPAGILGQIEKNPQMREWFEPVMFYRFAQNGQQITALPLEKPEADQDQVLLRFKAHIPRFSLFLNWSRVPVDQQCQRLADPAFDVLSTVLVDIDAGVPMPPDSGYAAEAVEGSLTRKNASVQTHSDKAGILMFTQRYMPEHWSVTVDGRPGEILRCNFLCMGVVVPEGRHEVEFYLKPF